MPEWMTIISTICSLVAAVFGICGISVYINERAKYKAGKKNKQEDTQELEAKKIRDAEIKKMMVEAVDEEVSPLTSSIQDLKKDMEKIKKGVQASNRADLEDLVAKADNQGWLSLYDKARFNQLYEAYHNLGKNGVMDASKDRVFSLPDHCNKNELIPIDK